MKEFTRKQIINFITELFPEVASVYFKNPKLRNKNEHQVFYIFDVENPVYYSKEIFEKCLKISGSVNVEIERNHYFEHWDKTEGIHDIRTGYYGDYGWVWDSSGWEWGRLTDYLENSAHTEHPTIRQTLSKTHVKVEFFVPGEFRSTIYFCEPRFLKYYNKSILKNEKWNRYLLW